MEGSIVCSNCDLADDCGGWPDGCPVLEAENAALRERVEKLGEQNEKLVWAEQVASLYLYMVITRGPWWLRVSDQCVEIATQYGEARRAAGLEES